MAACPYKPELINLGGGFGIPYFPGEKRLDLTAVSASLQQLLQQYDEALSDIELVIELGRFLVLPPPARPAHDSRWRAGCSPQESDQESADFRDREGDVLWAWHRPLLAAPTASVASAMNTQPFAPDV